MNEAKRNEERNVMKASYFCRNFLKTKKRCVKINLQIILTSNTS